MGRKRRTEKIGEGFVATRWSILNSAAYIALKPSSAKALPYFLGKGRSKATEPRIYFSFPYTEAIRLGFANSTFFNVIRDLLKKGFIDPIEKGGLRGNRKTDSKFALSNRWKEYGKPDFEEIDWKQFHQKLEN